VGGAKLAHGLAQVLAPEELVLIVNTGDDFDHLGLRICPDIDTVLYTLAGRENSEHGWGRAEESWHVMDELAALQAETWFRLGDKDIALHLVRRQMLDSGVSLTAATRELSQRLGVTHTVLPMADADVRTRVMTAAGELAFQEYFVHRRCEPRVTGFRFAGAAEAPLTPEITAAFASPELRGIIFCPSNPYVSIGPMLAVQALRQRVEAAGVPVLAVSPIIGGRALKGPAAKMMAEIGSPVSALAVARHYGKLIDTLLLDEEDRALLGEGKLDDPELVVAATVMKTADDRRALAEVCLETIGW
jgi:LPPG:FO 2-phospho-L-lactate transferase